MLEDAEFAVRVAQIHGDLLAARLALARSQGARLSGVSAGQLARVAAASREFIAATSAVLERAAPQLAAHAAVMAHETCQRDMAAPWPTKPLQPHLSLVRPSE